MGRITNAREIFPQYNLGTDVPPTVNDDATLGYGVGSRWIDTVNEWVCIDATAGAAIWKLTTR